MFALASSRRGAFELADVWHSWKATYEGQTVPVRDYGGGREKTDAEAKLESDVRKAFVQEFAKEPRIKGFQIETITIQTKWVKQFDLPDGAVWVGDIDAKVTFYTLIAGSPIEPATAALIAAILTFIGTVVTAAAYAIVAYFFYKTVEYLGEKAPWALGLGLIALILFALAALGVRIPRKEKK